MTTTQRYAGGSFAPPITATNLAQYTTLAAEAPPPIRDEMHRLIALVELFRQTPDSTEPRQPHPAGIGWRQSLEPIERARIDDACPWPHELPALATLFDTLDPHRQRDLRNAAHHLLWYAVELANDREPCTTDKLDQ